jgi:hypothetical protein
LPKGIVRDARYPNMYRLRLPDGTLSDTVNLTRAKDALRALIRKEGMKPVIEVWAGGMEQNLWVPVGRPRLRWPFAKFKKSGISNRILIQATFWGNR